MDATTIHAIVAILVTVLPTIIVAVAGFVSAHGWISKRRMTQAYTFASFAVSAAEELFLPGNGQLKEQYAITRLQERFKLSDEDAHLLVNAAVQGLRAAGIKPEKQPPQPPAVITPIQPEGQAA